MHWTAFAHQRNRFVEPDVPVLFLSRTGNLMFDLCRVFVSAFSTFDFQQVQDGGEGGEEDDRLFRFGTDCDGGGSVLIVLKMKMRKKYFILII